MTDLDLAPIEARLAAATPGPWEWDASILGDLQTLRAGLAMVLDADGDYCGSAWVDISEPDAELIANAPTDLAALIEEVKRLRAVVRSHFDWTEITTVSGPFEALCCECSWRSKGHEDRDEMRQEVYQHFTDSHPIFEQANPEQED